MEAIIIVTIMTYRGMMVGEYNYCDISCNKQGSYIVTLVD